MPTNRVTMRQIRETLRLHLQAGLSYNEVGRALKISKSVVGKYVSLARVAGVDWELAQTLSDEDLEARLYRPALPRSQPPTRPRLRRRAPGAQASRRHAACCCGRSTPRGNPLAYKYTSFCVKYREFAKRQQRSMRQIHIAGEKLFVDYAGEHRAHRRRGHRRDHPGPDLRGHAGRIELHLRLRHAAPDHRRLDRRAGARRWSSSAACPA